MLKPTTTWKKLIMWWPWAYNPGTFWCPRIDKANLCDTNLFPQPRQSENWSHTLLRPSPSPWPIVFGETLWGVQGLGDMSHPSPGMALQQTFLCFKLQGFSLALLCFRHMNLCSATKSALHTPLWSLPRENKNGAVKSRNLKIYINLPNAMLHPGWRTYVGFEGRRSDIIFGPCW